MKQSNDLSLSGFMPPQRGHVLFVDPRKLGWMPDPECKS
jgi:hypothetical protein